MNPLKIACVSDIHIGHRKNPAREIVANLYQAFPDNAETAELDILCLAGDVFDDLLTAPNEAFDESDPWLAYLLRLCAKHDIWLLVLEGTPGHDWKQMERILTLERMLQTGAKIKYVKTLSIEYFDDLGIHALFVPDEWNPTAEKTLEEVDELLRAKGIEQVDYAFMHGQFEYQLPPVVKAQKHSSQEYLKRVKHLIFIGHVHTHSRYDRIIAQGSFDRLAQNEEGPKGHVRATCWDTGDYDVQFVENTNAKRFLTVHCLGLSLEEILAHVDREAANLPEGSHVRVLADADNPILTNMEVLIRRYPLFFWTKKANDIEEQAPQVSEDEEQVYVPIALTKDNLAGMLMERIARSGAPEPVLSASRSILKEVI